MTRNQIEYARLLETKRSNLVNEGLQKASISETSRHNIVTENETSRANMARETETKRYNIQSLAETRRSNLARESETMRSNIARETENYRHNTVTEGQTALSLAETQRSNLVREAETLRSNLAREAETNRSNVASEVLRIYSNETDRLRQQEEVRTHTANELLRIAEREEAVRHNKASEGIGWSQASAASLQASAAMQNADTNVLSQKALQEHYERQDHETWRENVSRRTYEYESLDDQKGRTGIMNRNSWFNLVPNLTIPIK